MDRFREGGRRRGSVLLAALLVLTRRLLSAGRGTRGMGEWKRADLNRGPRGSSVALGGARSLLGERRGSSVALGRATSGGARSPPGELGRFALCGFLAPGAAQRLSLLFYYKLYLLSVAPQRSFTSLSAQDNARTMPPKAKNKEQISGLQGS